MSKIFPFTGGGSLDKTIFSQSEHVSSQIWCQKFFPLLGGGSLNKKMFSQSEQVSSQIWCQKFFPLLGEGPSTKKIFPSLNMYQAKSSVKNFSLYWGWVPQQNFFPSLNMYQAKSGVKNFSLYWGGVPRQNNFFPVWTCIKPNLVSKIFPFTETGYHLLHRKSETWDPLQIIWDLGPLPENQRPWTPHPPKIWDLGPPPTLQNLRPGTPPKSETWDPPSPLNRHTTVKT